MTEYHLSQSAQGDLLAIARYTVRHFGEKQAVTYRDSFMSCFEMLADNPKLGRTHDHIRLGLRSFDHKSHTVYYLETDVGVLVVRVLHERQEPGRHLE
ncbi:MAG: type II toxin-antitoxin system RelE/ParE family toxin [Magnetovibrio sp.]|nr:type II toxin-antitoxin system RelE/ParE family toxin [Magnetovibrio sp.]